MYFCFWSNCIESASKTEPSETIDFHVAFQSICHLVCTLCDYWFSSNAACGCFQYTDTLRNTNVFSLFSLCFFCHISIWKHENIIWNELVKSMVWIFEALVACSPCFCFSVFYGMTFLLCLFFFNIKIWIYFTYMNFTNTHNNRLIHYSLSLYTTCSTQKTMNVYNKINKQSSTHLICLSLSLSVCERECVYDVYCIRLFGCYVLFISLGCYLLWNRILNNESRACKSLPFIFVHFEQMLFEYYVM